jgi:hypothetical protein
MHRGLVLEHQRLSLNVSSLADDASSTLTVRAFCVLRGHSLLTQGVAELTVTPVKQDLRRIHLHLRQGEVLKVTVNGTLAKYEQQPYSVLGATSEATAAMASHPPSEWQRAHLQQLLLDRMDGELVVHLPDDIQLLPVN